MRQLSGRIMAESGERIPLVERQISLTTRTAYALGHVFNDLAAAMWFSYTLLFLQRVALLEPIAAGSLLLLGAYFVKLLEISGECWLYFQSLFGMLYSVEVSYDKTVENLYVSI